MEAVEGVSGVDRKRTSWIFNIQERMPVTGKIFFHLGTDRQVWVEAVEDVDYNIDNRE